jgi:hypothetical protein
MSNIRNRLAALEERINTQDFVFTSANGTLQSISTKRFWRIYEQTADDIWSPDAITIAESVGDNAQSIGCGHLPDLIRVHYHGYQRARAETLEMLKKGTHELQQTA